MSKEAFAEAVKNYGLQFREIRSRHGRQLELVYLRDAAAREARDVREHQLAGHKIPGSMGRIPHRPDSLPVSWGRGIAGWCPTVFAEPLLPFDQLLRAAQCSKAVQKAVRP